MQTFTAISVATALLFSAVSAQQQYTIDPNSVSNSTRGFWCQQQEAQCPLICTQTTNSGTTLANNCDPTALTYSCICQNGLSPNVSEYTQTLPFFICQEWGTQCVANCGSDSACASSCQQDHPCGAQSPVRQNTSTLTSTMSGSASGSAGASGASTTNSQGQVYTGFAGQSASSTGGSGGSSAAASGSSAASIRGAALNVGQTFGLLGLAGVLFGGFAILL